jgi:glucose-6-phosphate dehydrogenase assembly protein OpcA
MSVRTVELHDVERELDRQMKVLQGPGTEPVLRARMSNLVIFCDNAERAEEIDRDIPDICAVHPARVLQLIADRKAPDAPLVAEVSARPIDVERRRFAAAEEVVLHARGGEVERLPFAVRALLIGDLPTNLWWTSTTPPALAGPLLYELADQAQQIVYDSRGWPDPSRGVAATATWLEQVQRAEDGQWRVASDLNWRRLKYWRRLLGQAFGSASGPEVERTATEILIEHGPHAVVMAWELVSWLTRRLRWQVQAGKVTGGVEMGWRCNTPAGAARIRIRRLDQGPPDIRHIRIACTLDDAPAALDIVVEDDQRLAVELEGAEGVKRTLNVPPQPPAEVVGRQLSDRESDPVFHQSMVVAGVMARGLLA